MTQVTVNLIHDLKMKHKVKEVVPFVYGLRTGFLRAWLFVAVKVLFIFALMSGMNLVGKIEENVALLDKLIRNDFNEYEQSVILPQEKIPVIKTSLLRGPELGTVASDSTVSQSAGQPYGVVASDNIVVINSPNGTSTNITTKNLENYIDQVVRFNLSSAIAARFILPGTGDSSDGCLQIDSLGVVSTKGIRCRNGGGSGGSSSTGVTIGDTVTGATEGSVLFAGTSGVLTQDNTNFFFDNTANALTLGNLAGSGVQCLQASNVGLISGTGSACGGGGSQTPWTTNIDADNFSLLDFGNGITARAGLTVTATAANLTLATTTSGDINITPAASGSVKLGDPANVANGTYLQVFDSSQLIKLQASEVQLGDYDATANETFIAINDALGRIETNSSNYRNTSLATTGTTTSSAFALNVDSLTTGTGLNIASSSLSSGALINLAVTGTAGLTNQKGLNVSLSGANGTGAQTTYGGYFSNTHTGTSTNVGLYATATGGTNNYAAIFDQGNVGIGTTAPIGLINTPEDGGQILLGRDTVDSAANDVEIGNADNSNTDTIVTILDGDETDYITMKVINSSYNSIYSNEWGLGGRQSVSEGTTADFYLFSNTGNLILNTTAYGISGNVGVGTRAPEKQLEINSATGDNLRLTYNDADGSATNYADLLTTSSGDLSIVPSGGDVAITGNLGIGQASPDARLELAGNMSQAAWGLNGVQLQATAATYTDSSTAVSGTATNATFNSFAQPTLAATNTTVTTTNASTVYIANAPTAGTNQTIINAYALWVDAGETRLDGDLTIGGSGNPQEILLYQNGASSNGIRLANTSDGNNIVAQLYQGSDSGRLTLTGGGTQIDLFAYGSQDSYFNAGDVGFKTTVADRSVEINSATGNNLRLTYNDADGTAVNYADLLMSSGGDLTIAPSGSDTAITGNLGITSANTTQVTTASALALNVNSLTTGTGLYAVSSTLTSGKLVDLQVSGTAAASNTQTVLNVATSGANGTASQTTYGGYFSNTHTGTTSTNVGAYFTASGATNNYAAIFEGGNVGIGTTSPVDTLSLEKSGSNASFRSRTYSNTNWQGNYLVGDRAEGTSGTPLPVTAGDHIVGVTANAYANSAFNFAGSFTFYVEGAPSGSNVPTYFTLWTTSSSGSGERIHVEGAGEIGFNTSAPDKQLEINSATGNNLRLTYNDADGTATNYVDFLVNSSGNLTIDPSGGGMQLNGSSVTTSGDVNSGGAFQFGSWNSLEYTGSTVKLAGNSGWTDINLMTGGVNRLAIDSVGNITGSSTDLGNGTAGPVLTLGRNTNATNTGAGSINFQSKGGTAGYVWQDNAGNMRIHTAAPSNANDTSGTVIGTQSSVRSTKQDIQSYTDFAGALQMVADAPLHTFRYKKDVQGYGTDSPLAKDRIGYIADEVPGAFMWGNTIDQVSVNGILMASVKELNTKINNITAAPTPSGNQDDPLSMGQPLYGNVTVVLQSHLYLSGDSVGEAKILAGEKSVRISFDKPYEYQPIVTTTPQGRVGSEYWVSDKDASGFTIYIDEESSNDIIFDWHSFAGQDAKLIVSDGTTENIILGASSNQQDSEPEVSGEDIALPPLETDLPVNDAPASSDGSDPLL